MNLSGGEGRFIARNDDLRIVVSGDTEAKALLSFQEGVRELADFEGRIFATDRQPRKFWERGGRRMKEK